MNKEQHRINFESEVDKKPVTYDEMLAKLDEMYGQKEKIELALANIRYDIEFLETMIMFKFNKQELKKKEWP